MWRALLVLVIALAALGWGMAAAHYRVFPWPQVAAIAEPLAGQFGIGKPAADASAAGAPAAEVVASGLLNFDLMPANAESPIPGFAGAFALTERGLLIARRLDGALDYLERPGGKLRMLPAVLPPLNLDQVPARFDSGRSIRPGDIRYNDIEIVRTPGKELLFVTYNQYDAEGTCFRLRLDAAELPAGWETTPEAIAPLGWRQLLATAPCLPPSDERATFSGNQAGGRMALAPDGGLLVTTGDHEFDGFGRKTPAVSQAEGSDYGRVLHVDLADGSVIEVSRGHRNPQGLLVDAAGRIWVTEHGAMGGDELNLIVPGADYGWPSVSLGVQYADRNSDAKAWPANPRQGRHDGFALPQFAWIPSIAPSSLVLAKDLHPRWDGDILVGTLAGQAIRRVRLEADRVLYDETIRLNRRVRDLAVADGRIYALFDNGVLATLTPHAMSDTIGAAAAGESALRTLGCVDCHANREAPRLAGVFNAEVAAQPDIAYSEALRRVSGKWSRERLKAFLRSPETFAPGTAMPATTLTEAELDAVLDDLRALRP